MLKDQYANYVTQRLIDTSTKEQLVELTKRITPFISLLKRYSYGKHIISKLVDLSATNNQASGSGVRNSSNRQRRVITNYRNTNNK
jgi:pumilio RNA-binding family